MFALKRSLEEIPQNLKLKHRKWEVFAYIKRYIVSERFTHFISYCRIGREWFEFYDEVVRKIGSVPNTSNIYLAFYRRCP